MPKAPRKAVREAQKDRAIRNFVYGAHPPYGEGAALIEDQLRMSHRYRNDLIELEHKREDWVEAIVSHELVRQGSNVGALYAAAEAAYAAAQRQVNDAKAAGTPLRQLQAQAAAAKDARDAAQKARWAARATVKKQPDIAPFIKAVNQAAYAYEKQLRTEHIDRGLYWGNSGLMYDAVEASKKTKGRKGPIRFRSWFAEGYWFPRMDDPQAEPEFRTPGRLGVQISGGVSLDQVFAPLGGPGKRLVRIKPVDPLAYDPGVPLGRRRKMWRTTLYLRVSSDKAKPIWASFDIVMHRPLPAGAVLKRVVVSRTPKNYGRWRWEVLINFEVPDAKESFFTGNRPRAATGTCAINPAWRRIADADGRIRAAYVIGDDGLHEEIFVPEATVRRLKKSEQVRSTRDQHLNTMRPLLTDWLKLNEPILPEWLTVATRYIFQWKSHQRFVELAYRWRKHRFAGDSAGFDLIESWRYRNQHLYDYEFGRQQGGRRHRLAVVRQRVAELAQRYATVVYDDSDYRTFQKSPLPEEDRNEIATAKWQQQAASPSEFRNAFTHAFRHSVAIDGAVTKTCFHCGSKEQWDRAKELYHRCSKCGVVWDQDANACRNMLRAVNANVPASTPLLEGLFAAARTSKKSKRRRKNDLGHDTDSASC